MLSLSSRRRGTRRRPRRVRIAACVAALLMLGARGGTSANPTAQTTPPPVRDLEVGRTLDGQIASGQVHEFRVGLTKGDFVRIVVEQRGVDVVPSLYRPDQSLLFGRETEGDVFEPELLVAIADVTGTFTLRIRGAYTDRPAGRYAVRLEAARPAVPKDDALIAARRAFERARDIEATGMLGEYPKAIEIATAALEGFRGLGDRAGELKCLIEEAVFEWSLSRPETRRDRARRGADRHRAARRGGARRGHPPAGPGGGTHRRSGVRAALL